MLVHDVCIYAADNLICFSVFRVVENMTCHAVFVPIWEDRLAFLFKLKERSNCDYCSTGSSSMAFMRFRVVVSHDLKPQFW